MDIEKRKLKSKMFCEKRKQDANIKINRIFEKQTKKIRDIQNSLAKRQNIMALEALHKYSAYKIQCIWRSHLAQKVLYCLRLERFVKDWYLFRRYMKVRYRCARYIVYRIREHVQWKKFHHLQKCMQAARTIQDNLQRCVNTKKYRILLARNKFAIVQVNHIFLFAKARATRRITYILESDRSTKVIQTMLSAYGRRKRLAYLRGNY